jgi:hypothetical protein
MMNILTPSLAFFSNKLSRRYLGKSGLRKLSSIPYQLNLGNNAALLANTNQATATNHGYK